MISKCVFEKDNYICKANDTGISILKYQGSDVHITIPNKIEGLTVNSIGKRAFTRCNYIEKVVIPDGVINIGEDAFFECRNLKSVTLPDNVKISKYAFGCCTSLEKVSLPKMDLISEGCFWFCLNLREVALKKGLKQIEKRAFYGCEKLQIINFPDSIESIDFEAFEKTKIKNGFYQFIFK